WRAPSGPPPIIVVSSKQKSCELYAARMSAVLRTGSDTSSNASDADPPSVVSPWPMAVTVSLISKYLNSPVVTRVHGFVDGVDKTRSATSYCGTLASGTPPGQ